MKSILITGSDGFIGQWLVHQLRGKGYNLNLASRELSCHSNSSEQHNYYQFDLENTESISSILECKPDIIIHLAGLAHDHSPDREKIYQVNAQSTARFAQLANDSGVRLFIYLSTVKVHGNNSYGHAFTEDSTTTTANDDYALSKLEGEQALINVCEKGGLGYVILRPPLVYGPGVKANFLKLLSIIDRNVPLPISNFNNSRSYIYVENLCQIIEAIIHQENCRNQIYLVKDCDISTKDLVKNISLAFGRSPAMFKAPGKLVENMARLLNKKKEFDSLYQCLLIDDSKLRDAIGWTSSIDMTTAIVNTVNWYKQSNKGRN